MRPIRIAQAMLLSILAITTLGVADPGTRFNDLGHKMMCTCSCGQILLECNHVGCPSSEGMRNELMASIEKDTGANGGGGNGSGGDSLILQSFVQKYGPTVLAAPTAEGFNRIAWIMPFAVLLLGMLATVVLVRKWKLRSVATPAPAGVPNFAAVRDRIRFETDYTSGEDRSSSRL